MNINVGDKIRIIQMVGEPHYTGREGRVTLIDSSGQIHGTWGGCALVPSKDCFELIGPNADKERAIDWFSDIVAEFDDRTFSLLREKLDYVDNYIRITDKVALNENVSNDSISKLIENRKETHHGIYSDIEIALKSVPTIDLIRFFNEIVMNGNESYLRNIVEDGIINNEINKIINTQCK